MTTTTPLPSDPTSQPWVHHSTRFKPKGSTPTRRLPVGELPHSLSSPNITNPVNENAPPLPFAPKSSFHERVLHQRHLSTTASFPHPLHSNPTVASSGLTASVSTNDISQPRGRSRWNSDFDKPVTRYSNPNARNQDFGRRDNLRIITSRIPSPTFESRPGTGRRYVSTPMKSSVRTEHNHPKVDPHSQRLLRPISPPHPELTALPKSKTFAVFSSLTHSFSIPSLSNSRSSSRTGEPTVSEVKYSPPHAEFTTNVQQVHAAQPSAYWCGRYQALSDRFQNDTFGAYTADPYTIQEEDIFPSSPLLEINRNTPLRDRYPDMSDSPQPLLQSSRRVTSKSIKKTSLAFAPVLEDDDRRCHRIITYLEALCCTNAARKSLWGWQVQYARAMKNKGLLPHGGKMSDEKGWIGRVGRVITDGIGSGGATGRGTGMGKRSAFGFRRGKSALEIS